jgi:glycosyltransferase involved in cell wall biosynthesis
MKLRIILATISLHRMAGGLERNIVLLANYLEQRGHEVHMVTFDQEEAESFYPLATEVQWHKTGRRKPHTSIGFLERINLIQRIRRVIAKERTETFVICFHHGLLVRFLLASLFLKTRLIVSERSALSIYKHIEGRKWNLNFLLMFLTRAITVQFPRYVKAYPKLMQKRIVTIPNPVFPVKVQSSPAKANDAGRFRILTVGRLGHQKNLIPLVKAFSQIAEKYPEWDLVVLGEGEQRQKLETTISEKSLQNRIMLPGTTNDIEKFYLQTHIFCMPSLWEGFPNALAEAMSHGLPAVGYQNCAGVSDLIEHGKNGLLASGGDDINDLANVLATLMSDGALRSVLGRQAALSMKKFVPQRSFDKWENLLQSLCH